MQEMHSISRLFRNPSLLIVQWLWWRPQHNPAGQIGSARFGFGSLVMELRHSGEFPAMTALRPRHV